jgi:hypothetical protein
MVVLPSTGASRYHNCCIDGGTPSYLNAQRNTRTRHPFCQLSFVSWRLILSAWLLQAVFPIHTKLCISSHAPSRKRHITVSRAIAELRVLLMKLPLCHSSGDWNLEIAPRVLGNMHSHTRFVVSFTKGRYLLPSRVLHRVRSSTSFSLRYPLFSLRPSSSCLRLLPRLKLSQACYE